MLIVDFPSIQNKSLLSSNLISLISSPGKEPSHKDFESFRRLSFLPSEIMKVISFPPEKIFACGIECLEYNLPAHALPRTALSSM